MPAFFYHQKAKVHPDRFVKKDLLTFMQLFRRVTPLCLVVNVTARLVLCLSLEELLMD